ncbi:MAG: hypothetical protein WCK27_18140 [Verrucomicrobiota bacterium]
MTTDISEKGLETLIMLHMTGMDGLALVAEGLVAETPMPSQPPRPLVLAGSPVIPRTTNAPARSMGAPLPQSKAED